MHLACLINGAPPLLPLQFCCSLSACPLSRDWHSQPSADSLKLGLQPCSFLSTRTTYSEASGHPRSPQASCSFTQRCKARRPLSPWTRPPILDSRHSGLGGRRHLRIYTPRAESSLFLLWQTRFLSARPLFCRGSPCLSVSLSAFGSPLVQILPGLLQGSPGGAPSQHPCCHRVNLTEAPTHLLFSSPGGFTRKKLYPFP